jgi:transposase-like protein
MGTTTELEQLKAAIAGARRDKQGHRRYGELLTEAVREYAQGRLRAGTETVQAVARELGISGDTLWSWVNRGEQREARPRARAAVLPTRAKEFRAAVAALGTRTRNTPYPAELRALGLAHLKEREVAGASLRDVASELGIGTDSLRRWMKPGERARSKVRRVTIARRAIAGPATKMSGVSSLVVRGPAGLSIEGVDVATLVTLWKELS